MQIFSYFIITSVTIKKIWRSYQYKEGKRWKPWKLSYLSYFWYKRQDGKAEHDIFMWMTLSYSIITNTCKHKRIYRQIGLYMPTARCCKPIEFNGSFLQANYIPLSGTFFSLLAVRDVMCQDTILKSLYCIM